MRQPWTWTAILLLFVSGACATRVPVEGRKADDLDFKLSRHAWMEEGKLVTLIVGTLAARDRDAQAYMPLEIVVANNGLRQLVLTRESFTLIDADKNRFPAADPRELIKGYPHLDLDRLIHELEGIIQNKFAAYAKYPSNFSPQLRAENTGVVRDMVSVPKRGYVLDTLYFPTPPGGIRDQRFELFLDSPQLEDPIFVKFEVQ